MNSPAKPAPAQPSPGRNRPLSWILVGVLGALCVALTMALGFRTNEVTKLNERLAAAESSLAGQPTTAPAPAKPGAPVISPQPTTGPQADKLLALAKRDPNDPMAKGKVDAPLVMIEWADYRCPFCSKFALETRPQLQPYVDSGALRIEFHDLVLFGDESQLAARAARAAGQQGRYFEYAEHIWALHTGQGHPTVTQAQLDAIAQRVGLDMAKFAADMADPATDKAVQADTAQATSLGLNGTPFFLVGTTPVSGALPTESFVNLLEAYGARR